MLRIQLQNIQEGLFPGIQGLTGQTVHQIHGNILKTEPPQPLDGIHRLGIVVGTADLL